MFLPIKKMIPFFLFTFLTFVPIWFLGQFFIELVSYVRLHEQTKASIDRWEIVEKKEGTFTIVAFYHYEVGDVTYSQECSFQKYPFPNSYSAVDTLKDFAKENWSVWFDPHDPTFSTLFRYFPIKNLLRGLIALGIAIYFFLYLPRLKKKFAF